MLITSFGLWNIKTNATIAPPTTITTMMLLSFFVQKELTTIKTIIMGDKDLSQLYYVINEYVMI